MRLSTKIPDTVGLTSRTNIDSTLMVLPFTYSPQWRARSLGLWLVPMSMTILEGSMRYKPAPKCILVLDNGRLRFKN